MKKMLFLLPLLVLATQFSAAQFDIHRLTAGIVGTEVITQDTDHKLSAIDHPVGIGGLLGYQVSNTVALGLTMQYANGNLPNGAGTEKDLRGSLSLFVYPISFAQLHPYFSAGLVSTYKTTTPTAAAEKNETLWHGRFGIGAEYPVLPMVSLALDFGAYNDGMRFMAMGSSLGLRYTMQ